MVRQAAVALGSPAPKQVGILRLGLRLGLSSDIGRGEEARALLLARCTRYASRARVAAEESFASVLERGLSRNARLLGYSSIGRFWPRSASGTKRGGKYRYTDTE